MFDDNVVDFRQDPRDPNREQRLAERDRRYRESMQVHMDGAAIDRCSLCDSDGYRPNLAICDHVDRADIARRGIAACRAALAKGTTA